MRRERLIRITGGAALALAAPMAFAHTFGGTAGAGFGAGMAHPFIGLDHLAAMVAVGLWAAQLGGRAILAVPAAFLLTMTAGAAAAHAGVVLPAVESGIAASVLVLGLLVAAAVRLPLGTGLVVVAVFAAFHGHAHGSELPQGASAAIFAVGFVLATALLHSVGVVTGRLLNGHLRWLPRLAGAAVAGGGVLIPAG